MPFQSQLQTIPSPQVDAGVLSITSTNIHNAPTSSTDNLQLQAGVQPNSTGTSQQVTSPPKPLNALKAAATSRIATATTPQPSAQSTELSKQQQHLLVVAQGQLQSATSLVTQTSPAPASSLASLSKLPTTAAATSATSSTINLNLKSLVGAVNSSAAPASAAAKALCSTPQANASQLAGAPLSQSLTSASHPLLVASRLASAPIIQAGVGARFNATVTPTAQPATPLLAPRQVAHRFAGVPVSQARARAHGASPSEQQINVFGHIPRHGHGHGYPGRPTRVTCQAFPLTHTQRLAGLHAPPRVLGMKPLLVRRASGGVLAPSRLSRMVPTPRRAAVAQVCVAFMLFGVCPGVLESDNMIPCDASFVAVDVTLACMCPLAIYCIIFVAYLPFTAATQIEYRAGS